VDLSNRTHKKVETKSAAIEKERAIVLILFTFSLLVNKMKIAPTSGSIIIIDNKYESKSILYNI
jgi:hypothetical protein